MSLVLEQILEVTRGELNVLIWYQQMGEVEKQQGDTEWKFL